MLMYYESFQDVHRTILMFSADEDSIRRGI